MGDVTLPCSTPWQSSRPKVGTPIARWNQTEQGKQCLHVASELLPVLSLSCINLCGVEPTQQHMRQARAGVCGNYAYASDEPQNGIH